MEIRQIIETLEREDRAIAASLRKLLENCPDGRLEVTTARREHRFYMVSDGHKQYLGKKDADLTRGLMEKSYYQKMLKTVDEQSALLAHFLEAFDPRALIRVYEDMHPERKKIVTPLVLPDEEYIERWLKIMSEKASGEDYRSRVEVIYHNIYEKYEIPYVYEPSLHLDGYGPARPDFAVLNVRTRQTLYHEHFGMMDDEEYRKNNIWKLRCYHKNGYYEGINFFVTMESDGRMIDYEEAEQIVKKYCL